MDSLEELVCRPEISLSLGQLWTRLQTQAANEGKHHDDIVEEMLADNPECAKMFALLEIWLRKN